ncbi:DUF4260 family protein [Staphylococcus sp. Marseille-Q5304]|uniref:DUF4260 family protein n=1 Tax=Staphylococcus sp. Marseille-Q5304 TaxID=2942200 RepID=UPI002072C95E|nr:DUF4260 family protein [Staphylococcus sp. Marseille-Q5304]
MGNLIRLENAFVFITAVIIYFMFGFSLWIFLLFLLVPDISMLGYLIDKKIGSYVYNIGHSYIVPILITLFYLVIGENLLLEIALIWFLKLVYTRFKNHKKVRSFHVSRKTKM